MPLIIGDMRHVIIVKSLTSTVDEYGSAAESYATLMTLRAAVKFLSGSKLIDNKEIFSSQTLQFSTHYRSTITPTCRIEYEGKNYRILSIDVIGFHDGLTINTELINE